MLSGFDTRSIAAMASSTVNDVRDPAARAEVTERARKVFIPPIPLTDAEMRHWEAIVERRSAKEWETGIDLHIAAVLAKTLSRYQAEMETFDTEDSVIINSRGSPAVNPRAAVISALQNQILRYEARLRFDVEAGNSADRKSARTAERKAQSRDEAADADDSLLQKLTIRSQDDLLPRPPPQAVQ